MLTNNNAMTLLFLFAIILHLSVSKDDCRYLKSVKHFIEAKCANTSWYVYAGNTPCDGCCIRRDMVVLEPGKLQVTDTTTVNGQTTSVTYTVQRYTDDGTYYEIGNPLPLRIIDTDCETYGVVHSESTDTLQVFTAEPEQAPNFLSKIKGVKKCAESLYEYNPKANC